MSEDERQLLAVILDRPAEDMPRLVYADWLEEQGQGERAEFIRVQCELANWGGCDWKTKHVRAGYVDCKQWNELLGPGRVMTWCPTCARHSELRRRERELLETIGHEILGFPWESVVNNSPTITAPDGWENIGHTFRRGFLAEMECPWEYWRTHADAILKAQPIEKVVLTTRPNLRPCTLEGQRKEWVDDNGNLVLTAGWLMVNGNLGEEELLGFKKTISRREILAGYEQRARELFNLELDRAMTIEGFLKAKWRNIAFTMPTEDQILAQETERLFNPRPQV